MQALLIIRSSKSRVRTVAVALCLVMLSLGPAWAAVIGSPVIVVNQVTGLVPPSQPATLIVGKDVFANEVVKTGANSAARLVFEDKTVLEIGALSEVRLDKFVFDPNPAKSQVVLSVTTGVVRFATGVLPSTAYVIHTPSATLGVRGTVLTIEVKQNGSSCIFTENGNVIVTGLKKKVRVKAGEESCAVIGGEPSKPVPGSPGGAAAQMVALLSQGTTFPTLPIGGGSGSPSVTTSGTVSGSAPPP
jgi:hypothetical protein